MWQSKACEGQQSSDDGERILRNYLEKINLRRGVSERKRKRTDKSDRDASDAPEVWCPAGPGLTR